MHHELIMVFWYLAQYHMVLQIQFNVTQMKSMCSEPYQTSVITLCNGAQLYGVALLHTNTIYCMNRFADFSSILYKFNTIYICDD